MKRKDKEKRKEKLIKQTLSTLKEQNKRKKAKKQIHKKIYLKPNEDKLKQHNKTKGRKMYPIYINLLHNDSVNILVKKTRLEIYGKSTYIIKYILRIKIKKYKNLKNIKIEQINVNKYNQNVIKVPKNELKYIKNKLKEMEINYTEIVTFMEYFVEEEFKVEDNMYKKIYLKAKQYEILKNKVKNTLKDLENLETNKIKNIKLYISRKIIEQIKQTK